DGHTAGIVQVRVCGRPVITIESGLSGARDGGDDRGLPVDPADAIVVRVGDDQIAVGSDRDAVGRVELRLRGGRVVARETGAERIVAGGRPDVVLRVDATDDVVVRIGKVHVAVRGDGNTPWIVERRLNRRS